MVTVITDDGSYEFTASGWTVHQDNQLDVHGGDDETAVASFAPGRWIGVHQSEAAPKDT